VLFEGPMMGHHQPEDLTVWILTEGRGLPGGRFLLQLSRRLARCGVPLWRAGIYAGTLHPQTRGIGWRWARDRPVSEEVRIAQGMESTAEYLDSPLRSTIEKGVAFRERLEGTTSGFPLLRGFAAEGCTDFLALPLSKLGPDHCVVAWATDRPGGFSDSDLALLEQIRPALAATVEAVVVLRTARGLLDIYQGALVGPRILEGQIRRGQVEPLRAAIMAADLRGFTSLSDREPPQLVIEALNEFFGHVTDAVQAGGGHVLKFIGDGVLCIFETADRCDADPARAALAAGRAILARLAERNKEPQLRAGIGLHLGTVMYGNVGGESRLDFTVVGPAVNLAFRLESLTKSLGRPLLASQAFADAVDQNMKPLGLHPIRGFLEPEEVYGLAEHDPPTRA
jgi:adenylate cyclase